jgi:hypothetical protein
MGIHAFSLATAILLMVLLTGTSHAQGDHHGHAKPAAKRGSDAGTSAHTAVNQSFDIPEGLVTEHNEIHERLAALLDKPAPVGPAARKLAELLHHHFPLENEIALPPLGWLNPLASGAELPDVSETLEQTNRLRELLPSMLEEHVEIRKAAEALREAGVAAESDAAVQFAVTLMAHARHEEEVLYPAAVLVGEVLQLRRESGRL